MSESIFHRGHIFLLVAVLIGVIFRINSFNANIYLHGDVALYSDTVQHLAAGKGFLVDPNTTEPYFYSLVEKGGRLLEHNPLWPLLGAPLVWVTGMSGFTALKILSLLSGFVLLFFIYQFAKKIGGEKVAEFAVILSALSYSLIDYSGNGSFYIFQALLYLIFLSLVMDIDKRLNVLWLGILLGLGLLLNQQTLAMFFALGLYLLFYYQGSVKEVVFKTAGKMFPILGVMFLFYLPWGLRNLQQFGAFFYSIDVTNFWQKLGVENTIKDNVIYYGITAETYKKLFKTIITFWFPHNLYFVNRKLFILAPLTYIFAFLFMIQMFFKESYPKLKKFLPLVFLIIFHFSISAVWPVVKSRYLIPILPLVFILGGYYIYNYLPKPKWQKIASVSATALLLIFSVLTYLATPARTNYYDGTITSDIFGKNGELDFVLNQAEEK